MNRATLGWIGSTNLRQLSTCHCDARNTTLPALNLHDQPNLRSWCDSRLYVSREQSLIGLDRIRALSLENEQKLIKGPLRARLTCGCR